MISSEMNAEQGSKTERTGFIQYLVSVYFWIFLFLIPGLFFPVLVIIWLLTFPFDRRLVLLHKATCYLSDITQGTNPYWKISIEGRDRVNPKEAYIIVSNHQSGADIMALFKTHLVFKWVAKRSLFYFPFIGWNMKLNRYLAIDRSRGRSKLLMMDRSIKAVREGNSLMIFPEGTRTRDGNIQPFKTGAFRVAKETKVAILPIAIKGTYHAIKKGSLLINKNHELRAVILEPVPYESFKDLSPKETADKIHDLISSELSK
jgi:1-acyl-sn-glycerol-3-phosphate acyltransferase